MNPAVDKLDAGKTASSGPLLHRALSALVMMPVVLAAIYVGGRLFAGTVAFACVVMIFEWMRMVERREFSAGFYVMALGAAVSLFAAASGAYEFAFLICAGLAVLVAVIAKRSGGIGLWPALAAPYILAPAIALFWLRMGMEDGRALTFILFIVVWAADTGAFFLGKFIGGPKISHALSPSKTWAGIAGGVIGGSLIGAAAGSYFLGADAIGLFFLIGGILGAASVLGDLVESAFKRNFGVKDISGFIPGHGGALDRLDGMIFATTAMTSVLFLGMLVEKLQG